MRRRIMPLSGSRLSKTAITGAITGAPMYQSSRSGSERETGSACSRSSHAGSYRKSIAPLECRFSRPTRRPLRKTFRERASGDAASEDVLDLVRGRCRSGADGELQAESGHDIVERAKLCAGLAGLQSRDRRLPKLRLLSQVGLVVAQPVALPANGGADLLSGYGRSAPCRAFETMRRIRFSV